MFFSNLLFLDLISLVGKCQCAILCVSSSIFFYICESIWLGFWILKKFGWVSKISYDLDHRSFPADQRSWFWPSSLTLQLFFQLYGIYILAVLIDGFVCLFAFAGDKSSEDPDADGRRDGAGESCARGSSADLAGTYVSGQSGLTTGRRCDFCQFDYLLLSVIWVMICLPFH